MFTSLSIKNFRGIKDLTVEPLDRVNLIAGKNDVGKTSILEALYLHCNPTNAPAAIDMARLRGVEDPHVEDVADWLFFDTATESIVELNTRERSSGLRTSEMRLADARDVSDPDFSRIRELLKHTNPDYIPTNGRTLVAKFTDSVGLDVLGIAVEGRLGSGGISVKSSFMDKRAPAIPAVFLNSRERVAWGQEDAETPAANLLFNNLDAEGRQNEVVIPLQYLEPRLEGLSLNLFNGKTVIHGELEGVPRKVPLPLMGEGVARLLMVLSAIANAPHGVALVDEIENGLHHSVLVDVWKAIADAARRLDVQVFATTHSWECIRTAHEAFSQDGPYDLRLHRLDRIEGRIHAVTYDEETLGTSVDMAMEVR